MPPPPSATQLAFITQITTTVAGATMGPVAITARGANGSTATGFTGTVTVAIGTGPGGTLSGTRTVAAVAGVATFASLSIDKAGTGYTLTASASGLTDATSASFEIVPAAPNRLAFTVQPTGAPVGASIALAVEVTARDAFGNTATSFTGTVTLAIGNNPNGATLSGTTTAAALAGLATFPNLRIDRAGAGYTLSATATGLTTATSTAFDITDTGSWPAIEMLPIQVAPASGGFAGDVILSASAAMPVPGKPFLEMGARVPSPAGEKQIPNFEFYVRANAIVVTPATGVIWRVVFHDGFGDSGVLIRDGTTFKWVEVDHVSNVTVQAGDRVTAGQPIGTAGKTSDPALGRVELQVSDANQQPVTHFCPNLAFAPAARAHIEAKLTRLMQDIEQRTGDADLYAEATMFRVGCNMEKYVESQAGNIMALKSRSAPRRVRARLRP